MTDKREFSCSDRIGNGKSFSLNRISCKPNFKNIFVPQDRKYNIAKSTPIPNKEKYMPVFGRTICVGDSLALTLEKDTRDFLDLHKNDYLQLFVKTLELGKVNFVCKVKPLGNSLGITFNKILKDVLRIECNSNFDCYIEKVINPNHINEEISLFTKTRRSGGSLNFSLYSEICELLNLEKDAFILAKIKNYFFPYKPQREVTTVLKTTFTGGTLGAILGKNIKDILLLNEGNLIDLKIRRVNLSDFPDLF